MNVLKLPVRSFGVLLATAVSVLVTAAGVRAAGDIINPIGEIPGVTDRPNPNALLLHVRAEREEDVSKNSCTGIAWVTKGQALHAVSKITVFVDYAPKPGPANVCANSARCEKTDEKNGAIYHGSCRVDATACDGNNCWSNTARVPQ